MNTGKEYKYPSQEEIDKSIDFILDQGIRKKKNLIREITDVVSAIGFRNLFFGMKDVLTLSAVCGAAAYVSAWTAASSETRFLPLYLFFASPVLFLAYSIFSVLQDSWENVLPLKNTRRYRTHTVSSLQMMTVSFLSLAVLCVMSALMNSYSVINMLTMSEISFISLLMFSAGVMQCEKSAVRYRILIMPGIWITGAIMCMLKPEQSASFMVHSAEHLGFVLIPLLLWILAMQIRTELRKDSGGDYAYD